MKKLIWAVIIVITLWTIFRYFVFTNTHIQNIVQDTIEDIGSFYSSTTSWLVFVHDEWFDVHPVGDLESLQDEPDELAELRHCQQSLALNTGEQERCKAIEVRLSTYILADYVFSYSGFDIYVLDTNNISWHQDVLMSGIEEMTRTWTYPLHLIQYILTDTTWMNQGVLSYVKDLWIAFPHTDISRVFVSFEGQDGYTPVLHILFKKWSFLVRITNKNRANPFDPITSSTFSSGLLSRLHSWYTAQTPLLEQHIDTQELAAKLLSMYDTILASDTEYTHRMQATLHQALNWFAIK